MQGTESYLQFIFEHIEFLWIVPVVAFGFFIFLIQLTAQRKEESRDLTREVTQFNTVGFEPAAPMSPGASRLTQLEHAISTVTESLNAQQRAIEQFHRDNTNYNGEINELKGKLRELYKEYDIVLSENYSLRAKVKKLQGRQDPDDDIADIPVAAAPEVLPPKPAEPPPLSAKVDMKLYEDTRTLNLSQLDDPSECDINDLTRRPD
ncbi:MAG: hypothetical protein JW863_07950 [Chitinispirillaceae bacterium]|nr:hypothetical protein [Chitinispirillaceae bacterium]